MAKIVIRISPDEFNRQLDNINEILREEGGEFLESLETKDDFGELVLEVPKRGIDRLRRLGITILTDRETGGIGRRSNNSESLEDQLPSVLESDAPTLEEIAQSTGDDIFNAGRELRAFGGLEGDRGI